MAWDDGRDQSQIASVKDFGSPGWFQQDHLASVWTGEQERRKIKLGKQIYYSRIGKEFW